MKSGKLNISKSNRGKLIIKVSWFDEADKPKEMTVQNALISEKYNGKNISFHMEKGQITEITCEGDIIFTVKTQKSAPAKNNRPEAPSNKTTWEQQKPSHRELKNQMEMDHLTYVKDPAYAPYNFIPLNEQVVEAEEIPEFDRYHEGRFTGWIDLEIETQTPLYIRDTLTQEEWKSREERSDGDKRQDNPDFFSPAGRLRIPGSSLRGMIRTLVEMTSYSKFKLFNDKHLYFRGLADMSNLRKEYQEKMTSFDKQKRRPVYNISAGVLRKIGLDYFIFPSDWKQIFKDEAKRKVKETGKEYKEFCFYKLKEGYLIVSGNMPNKKRDWIILFPNQTTPKIQIPKEDIENYKNDATRADQVNDSLDLIECAKKGDVPCFYVMWKDLYGKDRVSFGHTGMFRLAYEKTIGEHIPDCLKTDCGKGYDLSEAIFGNEYRFSSRVFFEDAFLLPHQQSVLMKEGTPKILSTPKPTTFQHYLVQTQDNNRQLNHYNSNSAIRGYKLYWHKSGNHWEETDSKKMEKSPKQYTKIAPVRKNVKFTGRIRFENLSNVELGALLFCLDLPDGCCHKLGMGKPLGLGSIHIKSTLFLSNRKTRYKEFFSEWIGISPSDKKVSDDIKQDFETYILGKLCYKEEKLWLTKRLQSLLAMLTYDLGIKVEEKGMSRYLTIEPQNEFKHRPILPAVLEIKTKLS